MARREKGCVPHLSLLSDATTVSRAANTSFHDSSRISHRKTLKMPTSPVAILIKPLLRTASD
jgi:hypothetical protein